LNLNIQKLEKSKS